MFNKVMLLSVLSFLLVGLLSFDGKDDDKKSKTEKVQIHDPWMVYMSEARMDIVEFEQLAPHYPKQAADDTQESFDTKRKVWVDQYPDEVNAFLKHEQVSKINFSMLDLGLAVEPEEIYEDPLWAAIRSSGLSEKTISELMPNFPEVISEGNWANDSLAFHQAKIEWMDVYPNELEAFLNHPVVMEMKPTDSREQVELGRRYDYPEFMTVGTDITETKPVYERFKGLEDGKHIYEMTLKNWYFVMEPTQFESKYGKAKLPEDFDVAKYRKGYQESFESKERDGAK